MKVNSTKKKKNQKTSLGHTELQEETDISNIYFYFLRSHAMKNLQIIFVIIDFLSKKKEMPLKWGF